MKTLAEIDKTLQEFERRFGLAIRGHQQLSEAWFHTKLGVVSSSSFSDAVAKKGTATRDTYMCKLISEVCTGVIEEINTKHMDWGTQHEIAARSAYEFAADTKLIPLTFVFKDNTFRVGCSPDGIVSPTKGAEIKCPWNSTNYIKFLVGDAIKGEWTKQVQGAMWVMESDEWDVTMYDPRMKTKPLHTVTLHRDVEMHKQFDDLIPAFIEDMDKLLTQIGVKFGSQWEMLAKRERQAEATA
jgi:hypothetical protein